MSAATSKKTPALRSGYRDDTMTREVLRGLELMSPRPALPHVYCGNQLNLELSAFYGRRRATGGGDNEGSWVILPEPELQLENEDPIVPDIAGWRRSRMPLIPRAASVKIAPDWVCEVLSPSTERIDRTVKLDIYGAAGVGHVWLVDPLKQRLEVYSLAAGTYLLVGTHGGDAVIHAEPFAAQALELGAIWPVM